MASIELDEIKFHYALMQNAYLIMQSGVGDIKAAQSDYAMSRTWLQQHDAIGTLLEIINGMKEETK